MSNGHSFDHIAVALKLQANFLAERAADAEVTALRIGLFDATREAIVRERQLQADLIGEAYRIIRALTAVESTVRAIVDEAA